MMIAQNRRCVNREYRTIVERCGHPRCRKPSITFLKNSSLCQSHFVATCYARFDEINELLKLKKIGDTELKMIHAFVEECTGPAVSRALRARDVKNRDRAQHLEIVVSAAQILTRLRRGPRIDLQIPLRLVGDPVVDPRIEDTVTQTVSKHGAMFSCGNPYTKGEIMDIIRLDTGHTAIARVAWHQPIAPGEHSVAIEILNSPNFWNRDWA
jgi:hypothetical protein